MKSVGLILAKIIGALFMLAAVAVWWLFDYSSPGPLGVWQVLNWIIVAALVGSGWFLLTLGRERRP